jgi:eukaryotic-like serine/threonine-protein kinase
MGRINGARRRQPATSEWSSAANRPKPRMRDRKERLIAGAHSFIITPVTADAKPPTFDVWANLNDEEAAVLRSRMTEEHRPAGEVFIHDGAMDECVYWIREGEVEVRRRDQVLARLGIGDIVGEMAMLNRQPRNADVVAVTDCKLSRLTAADLFDLCQHLPALKIILTRLVAHRLSWSSADVLTRTIGSYVVVEQIGAGNMGWVFRAARGQAEFALKMLPHSLVQRPSFLDRFRREANWLQQLHHENIVQLQEVVELYGTIFLALEYVRGDNATEWMIQRGRPEPADVRTVTRLVVRALQAAHARAVVHCDVKSSNIMIDAAGHVKLVDFGIAGSLSDPTSVESGMTPGYAAPERFATAHGSPEADFYSLGVAAYEMLTGQMPFVAGTVSDWAVAHREQVPVSVRERQRNAPLDLAEFIEAALTKDPVRRRVALQPCLERWAEDRTPLVVSQPPLPRDQYRPRRHSQTVADALTVITHERNIPSGRPGPHLH